MASDSPWKTFFESWAADLPRRGVLVTAFNEQIPFANFLTSEAMLFFERTMPDSLGACDRPALRASGRREDDGGRQGQEPA